MKTIIIQTSNEFLIRYLLLMLRYQRGTKRVEDAKEIKRILKDIEEPAIYTDKEQ